MLTKKLAFVSCLALSILIGTACAWAQAEKPEIGPAPRPAGVAKAGVAKAGVAKAGVAKAGADDSAPKLATLSWKLGTFHKYLWLQKNAKIGETNFRFQRSPRGASGDYLLLTRRRLEGQGRTQETEGTLRFRTDGRTVSYREETSYQFANARPFKSLQEVRVRFERGKANLSFVNNGRLDQAAKTEVELAKNRKVYLFGTVCNEQWNLFTPYLDHDKTSKVSVLYSEMGKILDLEFTPKKKNAKLQIAGVATEATRFRFTAGAQKWEGEIWVDKKGRLLQFVSGELKIVLTSKPD